MSSQSKHFLIIAILLLTLPFMQACQPLLGDTNSEAAKGPQQTLAALGQQTQDALVQQTNTALASQPQLPASTIVTQTPQVLAAPSETETVTIPTPVPVILPDGLSIPINYGQKLSSVPRNQHIIYVFGGTQGDSITILLESSVLGPNRPSCINFSPAHTSFVLTTPIGKIASTNQLPQYSFIRDYLLPATGAYYINVSCSGRLCTCTQADLSLERK